MRQDVRNGNARNQNNVHLHSLTIAFPNNNNNNTSVSLFETLSFAVNLQAFTMHWFAGTVAEAIAEAKSKQAIFVVHISGDDELSRNMNSTLDTTEVTSKIDQKGFVAVKIESNSDTCRQFSQIYPVIVIPSTYFIGDNGQLLEIVGGALSPQEFMAKLDKVENTEEVTPKEVQSGEKQAGDASSMQASDESVYHSQEAVLDNKADDEVSMRVEGEKSRSSQEIAPEEKADDEVPVRAKEEKSGSSQETVTVKQPKPEEKPEEGKRIKVKKLSKEKAQSKVECKASDSRQKEHDLKDQTSEYIAKQKALDAARLEQQMIIKKKLEAASMARIAQKEKELPRPPDPSIARLQVRFPDGSSLTHMFSAHQKLDEVEQYIIESGRSPFSAFSLSTPFPRRQFEDSDYSRTLRELELTPCAVILVLPSKKSAISSSGFSIVNLVWTLFSPFFTIFNYFRTLVFGSKNTTGPQEARSPNLTGNSENSNSRSNRPGTAYRRQVPGGGSFSTKKEGNIHRMVNKDDDDENNTWNGNSTQQM